MHIRHVLRIFAAVIVAVTMLGADQSVSAQDVPSWIHNETTLCHEGVTMTLTYAEFQEKGIITISDRDSQGVSTWSPEGDNTFPGPCSTEPGDDGEEPGNGNGNGDEEPGDGNGNGDGEGIETPTQAPNAFTLTLTQRICTDQRFSATWTGANIAIIEFALSNSSDDWTSGWLSADPATGTFNADIDHHGYDKAVARVTFADGTTQDEVVDMSICVSEPTSPPVTEQPGSPSKPAEVTSLPKTGSGEMVSVSVAGMIAMTASLVAIAGGMVIRRQRG
ncbi:MAG: LPXTG cell wall anchor domain-containing protein [Thermomicrobiales bacterium]|nr:LPXTG cell wall anchor domain-containing protein [Thermomicrobiales bacterium]MCO5218161.1 LPXTG cell wall anchor domain-containing protein [Thermomicrobiales bacterium]MCO5224883.1 LPXTG cell wall anchor domain-containing protein [Thermomicrobiales bacterium]MCO5228939.1 LPXTG cell wall anchor domain-containing protein [Thermomicrobiales bacterium]